MELKRKVAKWKFPVFFNVQGANDIETRNLRCFGVGQVFCRWGKGEKFSQFSFWNIEEKIDTRSSALKRSF